MKRVILYLALIISTSSCIGDNPRTITGKGDTVSETRSLETFSKVESTIGADINIIESEIYEVRVTLQENLLPYFNSNVSSGTLKIDFGNRSIQTQKTIVVDIYTPSLSEFMLTGAGDVTSNIAIGRLSVTGAGDITCAGEVDNLTVNLSGAANFNLYSMPVKSAYITISGTGDVYVTVEEQLDVMISGVGNVYYKGNPTVSNNISGVGNVVDRN